MLPNDKVRYACDRARHEAARVARRLDLPACDVEDLAQDILLAALHRARHFDPRRGAWTTFLSLLSANAARDCARRQIREQAVEVVPLDHPAGQGSQFTIADILPDDARLWGPDNDAVGVLELRHDLMQLLLRLDPRSLRVAVLLFHHPPVAAADRSGLSRATFYRRRNQLVSELSAAGLRP